LLIVAAPGSRVTCDRSAQQRLFSAVNRKNWSLHSESFPYWYYEIYSLIYFKNFLQYAKLRKKSTRRRSDSRQRMHWSIWFRPRRHPTASTLWWSRRKANC